MTKPPAMPELIRMGYEESGDNPDDWRWQLAHEAERLAALQSAQPAEVSDAEIDAHLDLILRAAGSALKHYTTPKSKADLRAALRSAILALRPQAVPMTEADLLACVVKANCLGGVPMSNRNGHYHIDTPSDAVVRLKDAIESHHGITAPAGGVLHAAHQPAKEPSK